MATKNTPAKKQSTAVVNWESKLAQYAEAAATQEEAVGTSNFLSFKAGVIAFQGNPVANNKLQAVVVDSVMENVYYDTPYDEDDPRPPVCFAFGRDEKEMKPHEKASKPQAQSCSECEWNKFGSAENGKGKACANRRRIALLPAEPLTESALEKSKFALAKLPVMSVANWAGYVRTLKGLQKRPPMGVVTEISTVPDTKSQFRVVFNHKLNLKNELLGIVDARMAEAYEELTTPYTEPPKEEPKPKRGAAPAKKQKYR